MAAFRCSLCSENWPTTTAYKRCPVCGGETYRSERSKAMLPGDAQAILNNKAFVEHYERTRGAHPDAE